MNSILVTGGAGYVGTILVPTLLRKGYAVRVYDNLHYGQTVFQDLAHHARFNFVRGDVRNHDQLCRAAEGCDVVVHLAAIVGAPACYANPELSYAVNVDGTQNALQAARGRPFLFPSTGSCYGKIESGFCTEETSISPLSEYGRQKAQAEALVTHADLPWLAFRFATVFGPSPRPRLDLLINDFVYQVLTRRSLVIYEAGFRRTFLHVRDAADVFVWAIEGRRWREQQVYNVGDDQMNFTKAEVAQRIASRVPGCILNLAGEGRDPDVRDYAVSYAKINEAGWRAKISFDEGLDELFKAVPMIAVRNPFSNAG